MAAKKKSKSKKLTVQQVKELKAGYTQCSKTKCNADTCGLVKSAAHCKPDDDQTTVSVVASPTKSGGRISS
ncbi:MAG: hypothetical protein U0174_12730 [Polyangiaceae bacterium]